MYIEYNANLYGANIDDCICRAITKATGKPYMEVFDGLIAVADANEWEVDELRTMVKYLDTIGWEWCDIEGKWTVNQYAQACKEPRILIVNGHATYSEGGNIYDTWNPSRWRVHYVFRKRMD